MNKRIEALAKQAAEYAIEFAVKDQELYIPKLMEKFAELIVKECLNELCEQMDKHNVDLSNLPSWYKALAKTEEHFGVK